MELTVEPAYVETPTSEKIFSALGYAHAVGDLAVIFGAAGVGKTTTLRQYQSMYPSVWVATMSPSCSTVCSALHVVAETVGLRDVGQSALVKTSAIREKLKGTRGLLIIDEAQHLSYGSLEELRSIHDATGVSVALVGNDVVRERLTGGSRQAHFAQLYSRIGVQLHLKKSEPEDAAALAEAWGIRGEKELGFVREVASRNGGLRSATKVIRLAARKARGGRITVDHLKAAGKATGAQE
jgi:hypothetical protein